MLRLHALFQYLVVALVAATLSSSSVEAADGVFMVVKGDVKVESKGKITPARVGSKVLPSDKITAGKDSRAKVVMSDKNVLNISPDTVIVVEKYVFDEKSGAKEVSLNVLYGKVRATVNQKYDGDKTKFQVKTPSAVAGVRGTDFLTSYSQTTGSSKIVTFEGSVQMGSGIDASGNIANPVMVTPGQFAVASSDGAGPSQPAPVPATELKAMNQETKAETAGSAERSVASEQPQGGEKKEGGKDGEKGPDGKGPDGKGPDGKGPDGKGPDGKGPDGKGPDGKGPDGKGPDGRGPSANGPGPGGPPPPSMLGGDASKELTGEPPPMLLQPQLPPMLADIYRPPELPPDLIQQKTNLIININLPQ